MTSKFRNLNKNRTVTVICTNNEKSVTAEMVRSTAEMITVELPGGLRLNLYKHTRNPSLYVGNSGGLEFRCDLSQA